MRKMILLTPLLLAGCVTTGPIIASQSACSTIIPDSWRSPVPGAPLPAGEDVGDWVAFGDAQTGQLDKANGRTADSIGIVERCEQRDREAIRKSRPKFLGIF